MSKKKSKEKLPHTPQLGYEVEDIITGAKGIVTGKTEWLTSCDTYYVEPKSEDGTRKEPFVVDVHRLIVTDFGVKKLTDIPPIPPKGRGT